ncbi:6-phospho-3-hexuloisomerase [Cryobacterium algoritolerans]|uniref:6-phospho-3-hexuloisomerase n=1 Tax=Cryobacterium algoritolerans TaxID=1259184 RepID=A0A4R8WUI4_9MICO|nr:6-phospho-3-hexuloisomerase [Cryobacterium algoritolerans]TFC17622.1 6-phospho-3-hexuloisomerase [Cryobacterium algoritolerans]
MPSRATVSRPEPTPSILPALELIAAENAAVILRLLADAEATLDSAAARLLAARSVFVFGVGRSGLALKMTAMRLMHLGLRVHVVGETTAPAIGPGDVLLVASGSGSTGAIVRAAEAAAAAGAGIVAITTDLGSPLGGLAKVTVVVPAARKQDHDGQVSAQYSGGLFEQSVVVIGDAIFHGLWKASGASAEELWPRHANLE